MKLTAKLVRQYLQKSETERRIEEDSQIRDEVLKQGASAVRIEAQYKAPATLSYVEHGPHDLLTSGQILNLSEKSISGVRLGALIKSPNEPDDLKIGNWTLFQVGVEPEAVGDVGAQKFDTTPMFVPGTVARLFIVEIKFEDGSVWKREEEKKGLTRDSALTPEKPSSSKTTGSR